MSDSEFNVNEGVPPDDAINDKTITDDVNQEAIGDNTAQLSDVSENDEDAAGSNSRGGHLSTWYRRIQPLVRNKRVRIFAIFNFILTLFNLVLFAVVLGFFAWFIYMRVAINIQLKEDKPCFYEFTAWSECSANCAMQNADGSLEIPSMTRTVKPESIVRTRGSKYPACPEGIDTLVESAPCHTAMCPRELSSFNEWTECFYNNATLKKEGGCYRIRKMVPGHYLIKIDTDELTKACTEEECPEIMP